MKAYIPQHPKFWIKHLLPPGWERLPRRAAKMFESAWHSELVRIVRSLKVLPDPKWQKDSLAYFAASIRKGKNPAGLIAEGHPFIASARCHRWSPERWAGTLSPSELYPLGT